MKNHVVCLAICVSFLFAAWGETVLSQTTQLKTQANKQLPSVKDLQTAALKSYVPSLFPEVYKVTQGTASVEADASTNMASLTGIMTYAFPHPTVQAGFFSGILKNAGTTDWSGVTVSATFDVRIVTPYVIGLMVDCQENRGGTWYSMYLYNRDGWTPGDSRTYTFASMPFTMKANTEYRAVAYVDLGLSPLTGRTGVLSPCYASVRAIISSIKFIFP